MFCYYNFRVAVARFIDGQVIDNIILPLYYTVLFLLDYSHQFHLHHQYKKKKIIINIDILSIIYQVKCIITYHDDLY